MESQMLAEIADFFELRAASIPHVFWSMVGEGIWIPQALEESGFWFGLARLERWGLREVEAISFLCHAGKSRQP